MQFFLYNNNVTDGSSSVQTWKGYKKPAACWATRWSSPRQQRRLFTLGGGFRLQLSNANLQSSPFMLLFVKTSWRVSPTSGHVTHCIHVRYVLWRRFDASCLWTRPQLMLLFYVQQQQRWLNSVYAALTRRRLYTLYNCAKAKTEGCRIGLYLHCTFTHKSLNIP